MAYFSLLEESALAPLPCTRGNIQPTLGVQPEVAKAFHTTHLNSPEE